MVGNQNNLNDAVKTAKEAVQELEEPLKTEAFKILLQKLIAGGDGTPLPAKSKSSRKTVRASNKSTKSSARKKVPAVSINSTLDLSVDQLRNMKSYCDRFSLSDSGSEQVAFIIANYLREHTELSSINAADIAYCYRQLVSQKVKLPAVNDIADWARALYWLTAPSRKKEWLVKKDNGYVVSNAGLLRFNELEAENKLSKLATSSI